jgi:TP901-1 family phage major tail protein
MGTCNTSQKEMGGKDLLLKTCVEDAVDSTATSATLTATAHGMKVGDIVKFGTIGANTVINTTTFYYVKTVPTVDTFTISATRSGAAIVMDDTEVGMVVDKFVGIGGLRSKSMNLSAEGIDISSEDSDEWKVMLDKAGIRSMEISGSGIHNNADVFQGLVTKFLANELVCMMFVEAKTGRLYEGCFKLTSLEVSGDYDAESSYSISAASSGAISTAVIAA